MELSLTAETRERLAQSLRLLGGVMVRWRLATADGERVFVGRVARASEWLAAEDPHLLVAPGRTNLTNVLAFIAVHVRWRDTGAYLVRRRSYEEEPLEWEPLGPGPIRLTIERVPENG